MIRSETRLVVKVYSILLAGFPLKDEYRGNKFTWKVKAFTTTETQEIIYHFALKAK